MTINNTAAYTHRLTLSPREAAALLGVSQTLIRTQIQEGIIPVTRLGKRLLIPRAAIETLAQTGEQSKTARPSLRAL